MSSGVESTDKILTPEEKAILTEQRKRASSDTQSLIKIIDRLSAVIEQEREMVVNRDRVLRNVGDWYQDPSRQYE